MKFSTRKELEELEKEIKQVKQEIHHQEENNINALIRLLFSKVLKHKEKMD
jgi:hypothetical protein